MRVIFFGSGQFGVPCLQEIAVEHELLAVVTQPDRPAGRRRVPTSTPVAKWAEAAGHPVLKTQDANDLELVKQLASLKADAGVVIAFGQKLSELLIEAAGPFVVNLHASLLPRYRGAAPINWAMIQGETQTGLSIIGLAQQMDAGRVYASASTPIDPQETAGELHDRLASMGPGLMSELLRQIEAGERPLGHTQDDAKATRAPKLTKKDGWVNFDSNGMEVRCRIHGLTPWPGVSVQVLGQDRPQPTSSSDDQILFLRRVAEEPGFGHTTQPGTVLSSSQVAVRDGALRLLEVQRPGGRVMSIEEYTRGHPLARGDRLISVNSPESTRS